MGAVTQGASLGVCEGARAAQGPSSEPLQSPAAANRRVGGEPQSRGVQAV